MGEEKMDRVHELLDAAENLRMATVATLHRAPSTGERATLVGAYLDTVIEHHESVTMLVRTCRYGSAFALARPIYEATLRGCWVNACASEEEVRQLRSADHHETIIPRFGDLLSKLAVAYKLTEVQNLKTKWEALCSYSHTGLRQLGRRGFRGAKPHGYSRRAIVEILDLTTSSLASLAKVYFVSSGNGIWALFVTAIEKEYYAPI
jgi:hypothetical protein